MNAHLKQPRAIRSGFTLAEIICSLMIFAMVATAGTYLLGAMNNSEAFFRDGTTSQSEVEFALGRIVENVRAAKQVTGGGTLTILSLPSPLIGNNPFTITYGVSGGNLVEIYVNTATGTTYSTSTLVHGMTSFSVTATPANAKAFTVTLSAGTEQPISRSVTVFGRNL